MADFVVNYLDTQLNLKDETTPANRNELTKAGVNIVVGTTSNTMTVGSSVIANATNTNTMSHLSMAILDDSGGPSKTTTLSTMSLSFDGAILSSPDSVKIVSAPFQPDELLDSGGSPGTAGYYLASGGAAAAPVWTELPAAPSTPNLAAVLAEATAGDAENQPISNLSSLGFQVTGAEGQVPLALTAVASPTIGYDVLNVSYPKDEMPGRIFANAYIEISVAGVHYWIQLYSQPA